MMRIKKILKMEAKVLYFQNHAYATPAELEDLTKLLYR